MSEKPLGKSAADKPGAPQPDRGGTGMYDLLQAAGDVRDLVTRLIRLRESDAATLAAELGRHPDEVALALEHLVARGEVSKRQHGGQWLYRVVMAQRVVKRVEHDVWGALDDEPSGDT